MSKATVTEKDLAQIAETMKAAAHPGRLAILFFLWKFGCRPMNVKHIYQELALEQPVVSRHLGILWRCGLLGETGAGNNTNYFLNMDNAITKSMINCLIQKHD